MSNTKSVLKNGVLLYLSSLFTALVLFGLGALAILLIGKGLSHFWLEPVYRITYVVEGAESSSIAANQKTEFVRTLRVNESDSEARFWLSRDSFSSNRPDRQFIVNKDNVVLIDEPENLSLVELIDGRNILAIPDYIKTGSELFDWRNFSEYKRRLQRSLSEKRELQLGPISSLHAEIDELDKQLVDRSTPFYQSKLQQFYKLQQQLKGIEAEIDQYEMVFRDANNQQFSVPLQEIDYLLQPNRLSYLEKIQYFFGSFWRFLTDDTKDANQSGGVFPAIFGTVLMVLLMTVMVAPLGIVAAIYLTEYAPNNQVIFVIRVAVSNLAGVPSVVYGVFGLGFLVYQVGGNIDALFYSDNLPTPTFGTPGLLWASLTLALLTLPVVIVATEEGLRRVPQGIRKASYALGATKYETIRKVVLPVASSSLMTGIILAIARGAGEVAPMLLVGAVKYAPVLPIDGEFPFLHLERQFMHLGVMIYDGAFHGQIAQEGSTLMFAACFLLLLVVTILNLIAIFVRNRLQIKYRGPDYA